MKTHSIKPSPAVKSEIGRFDAQLKKAIAEENLDKLFWNLSQYCAGVKPVIGRPNNASVALTYGKSIIGSMGDRILSKRS